MSYDLVLQQVKEFCRVGKMREAAEKFEQALEDVPTEADSYANFATSALESKDWKTAKRCFKAVSRLEPNSNRAYFGLGLVCQKQGHYDRAAFYFSKSFLANTNDFNSVLHLFQISVETDNFEQLERCLEIYIEDHPDDISVMLCLASLYLRQGDYLKTSVVIDMARAANKESVV